MELGWFVCCVHDSPILTSVLSYLHISNNVYVLILRISQNGLSRRKVEIIRDIYRTWKML